MNILILNGSPRKNGNTSKLINAFEKGIIGHTVTTLSAYELNIKPCIGCNFCLSSENHDCFQKDDMDKVYRALQKTDILVIASPVYFYGLSSPLKALIDRLHTPKRNIFPVKKMCLLLVAGSSNASVFAPILSQYNEIISYFSLENGGVITQGNLLYPSDIEKTDALKRASALAQTL